MPTLPSLEFDPKISIEGIATALGVIIALVGGVLGFLIGFFRSARARRQDRRERADRLTIMEILERDLFQGLTETQIKELFRADETAVFRKKAGASNPQKLSEHDFSRYLRDLQWSHMIDQIEKDKYRMRSTALSYEQSRARQQQFVAAITQIVPEQKIIAAIERHYDALDDYERSSVVRALLNLGRTEIVGRLAKDLEADDPKKCVAAAKTLLSALSRD